MTCRFKTLLDTIEEKFEKALHNRTIAVNYKPRIGNIMNIYKEVRNHECKLACEREEG